MNSELNYTGLTEEQKVVFMEIAEPIVKKFNEIKEKINNGFETLGINEFEAYEKKYHDELINAEVEFIKMSVEIRKQKLVNQKFGL